MKTIAILGSRNTEGQTARALDAFVGGVTAGGGEVETILLPERRIERCRQCDPDGWGLCRREARCVIEDDFADLVERVRRAHAVVVATPVYYGDLSESIRAFLDRLRRICTHGAREDRIAGKPAAGICVAGGGGGGAPECAVSLKKVLVTCGFDVVDIIPARRQNLDMKLAVLETTGKWFAGMPSS